jgi:hypothetical protein
MYGDQWHRLYAGMPDGSGVHVNAVNLDEPLAPYEMLCGLLVPLYAARAAEEVLYGRRGVTLQTAREVRARSCLRLLRMSPPPQTQLLLLGCPL